MRRKTVFCAALLILLAGGSASAQPTMGPAGLGWSISRPVALMLGAIQILIIVSAIGAALFPGSGRRARSRDAGTTAPSSNQ